MSFVRRKRIHFSDCDPAGIVFYPQYFVLCNDLLEEWIDDIYEGGLADYIVRRRIGMPTVRLEAEFKSVSRMGEEVMLSLEPTRIGTRSFELLCSCTGPEWKVRMSFRQTIVTTSLETYAAIPIPPELRAALCRHLSEGAGGSEKDLGSRR